MAHALGAFVEAARERAAERIVGITAASADPAKSARLWRGDFASVGVHRRQLPARAPDDPRGDREAAARIDDAGAVSSSAAATR